MYLGKTEKKIMSCSSCHKFCYLLWELNVELKEWVNKVLLIFFLSCSWSILIRHSCKEPWAFFFLMSEGVFKCFIRTVPCHCLFWLSPLENSVQHIYASLNLWTFLIAVKTGSYLLCWLFRPMVLGRSLSVTASAILELPNSARPQSLVFCTSGHIIWWGAGKQACDLYER